MVQESPTSSTRFVSSLELQISVKSEPETYRSLSTSKDKRESVKPSSQLSSITKTKLAVLSDMSNAKR